MQITRRNPFYQQLDDGSVVSIGVCSLMSNFLHDHRRHFVDVDGGDYYYYDENWNDYYYYCGVVRKLPRHFLVLVS